ncbi:putative uncharacterized protein CCDC28A-AS1, partial [Plecturocebus cupreus]
MVGTADLEAYSDGAFTFLNNRAGLHDYWDAVGVTVYGFFRYGSQANILRTLEQPVVRSQPVRHNFSLSSRLECSDVISTHCSLHLPGSSNSASVSRVAETAGVHRHTRLIF